MTGFTGGDRHTRFARWSFGVAAAYGLLVTLAGFVSSLAEGQIELLWKAAFFGAAAATQLLYVALAREPARYRGLIPIGIASKASFVIAVIVCFQPAGDISIWRYGLPWFALVDALFAATFAFVWWRLRQS